MWTKYRMLALKKWLRNTIVCCEVQNYKSLLIWVHLQKLESLKLSSKHQMQKVFQYHQVRNFSHDKLGPKRVRDLSSPQLTQLGEVWTRRGELRREAERWEKFCTILGEGAHSHFKWDGNSLNLLINEKYIVDKVYLVVLLLSRLEILKLWHQLPGLAMGRGRVPIIWCPMMVWLWSMTVRCPECDIMPHCHLRAMMRWEASPGLWLVCCTRYWALIGG